MPRNRRFHWILPAKAALPPLETTAKAACPLWNSLPTGRSRPYWKPRTKGIAIPLESQLVLKGVPTNEKWFVRIHFKTQKSHSQSSIHERKVCGILFAARMEEHGTFVRYVFRCRKLRSHPLLNAPAIESRIRSIPYYANLPCLRISDSRLLHHPNHPSPAFLRS